VNVTAISCAALVAILFLAGTVAAEDQISAEDFIAPVDGGPSEVIGDVRVEVNPATGETVLTGDSAQNVLNAAVRDRREGLVRFGSGFGFIVSGEAAFQTFPNPDATLVSRRLAFVKAYENAKKQLSVTLHGLSNESAMRLYEESTIETTQDETRSDIGTDMESRIDQFTEGMLRGFVVYEISEDQGAQLARVSLVTTPKTVAAVRRVGSSVISAGSLSDGLEKILSEVKAGVVAPVGGRIIDIEGTDEIALVGFGSEIVRHSDNPAVRARMRTMATQAAIMRATDALCGLMTGQEQAWSGSLTESTLEQYRDFELASTDDPLDSASQIASLRTSFVNRMEMTEEYTNATNGEIPPGTIKKNWLSEDGNWSLCVAVYSPSAEAHAQEFMDAMKTGSDEGEAPGGPNLKQGTVHDDGDL